jgi:hypothetical protein
MLLLINAHNSQTQNVQSTQPQNSIVFIRINAIPLGGVQIIILIELL